MPGRLRLPPMIEFFWLAAVQQGISMSSIAKTFKVSWNTVERRIRFARTTYIPNLEIVIPFDLTPKAACTHPPIEVGDKVYCVLCHQTGIEDHPLLKRDPKNEPRRDKKPKDDGLKGGKGKAKDKKRKKLQAG